MVIWHLLRALLRVVFRDRAALAAENLALRHQLVVLRRSVPRPALRDTDRALWAALVNLWEGWSDALHIVRPATVLSWHRAGFRFYWRWKSRPGGGRPGIPPAVRQLIRRMATANPLWGAPRIRSELAKLGIEVSEATVARVMGRRRKPPSPTWRAFLDNHVKQIVAVDFFVVPTLTFRILYVFVVLSHDRRRIRHVNVTASPSAEWTSRQIVQAFPWDEAPRFVVRDGDRIYGEVFQRTLERMLIEEVRTAPRSPWQNAFVERVIGTLRRECTDHVIVSDERHLRRILREYVTYYNEHRCHQSLDGDAPCGRDVEPPDLGPVIERPMAGGLHHRYSRRAA